MGERMELWFRRSLCSGKVQQVHHFIVNEGFSANHHFTDGAVPLQIAVERNHAALTSFLLDMRAKPNIKTNAKVCAGAAPFPLCVAVKNNNSDIVRSLLNAGAQADTRDGNQRSSLHLACSSGSCDIAQILLQHKADVNARDRWRRTPLHLVLYNLPENHDQLPRYNKIVLMLLANGAKVNVLDRRRMAPLHLAAASGDHTTDICRLLISRGANTHDCPMASRMVCSRGHVELCRLFLSENFLLDSLCMDLAISNSHSMIQHLLACAGVSPSFCEKFQDSISGISRPYNLQILCRKVIRSSLGNGIHQKVNKLEYPERLKDFILMRDILS